MPQIVHVAGLDPAMETRLLDEFTHLGAVASPCTIPDQVAAGIAADALVLLPWAPEDRFRSVVAALATRNNGAAAIAVLPERSFELCQAAFRAGAVDVLASPASETSLSDLLSAARRRLERKRAVIRPLKDIERDAIASALVATRGSVSKTARDLGIGRSTLYRKLDQYDLEVPR